MCINQKWPLILVAKRLLDLITSKIGFVNLIYNNVIILSLSCVIHNDITNVQTIIYICKHYLLFLVYIIELCFIT